MKSDLPFYARSSPSRTWAARFKTFWNKRANHHRNTRWLEIGPGADRIEGFETLNVVNGPCVDYVLDATQAFPFEDGTFDLIYASHILEHVPWYRVTEVLGEWTRVLKSGGALEIWVPNGLKICKAFVDAELNNKNYINEDGWYRFNPDHDPCVWASGRIFAYGDGMGKPIHPNWHRGIFSPRFLQKLMKTAGLRQIRELDSQEIRGVDHGWINLGMRGVK